MRRYLQLAVVVFALFVVPLVALLVYLRIARNSPDAILPEPLRIREAKINPELCSATNCEACDKDRCAVLSECSLHGFRWRTGIGVYVRHFCEARKR